MDGEQAFDGEPRRLNPAAAQAGAYQFGALAITSLVTSCGGALIAMLSFAGQLKAVDASALGQIVTAISMLGGALLLSLLCALGAYINQFLVAFDKERVWVLWLTLFLGVAAIGTLGVGGLYGVGAVAATLRSGTVAGGSKFGQTSREQSRSHETPQIRIRMRTAYPTP